MYVGTFLTRRHSVICDICTLSRTISLWYSCWSEDVYMIKCIHGDKCRWTHIYTALGGFNDLDHDVLWYCRGSKKKRFYILCMCDEGRASRCCCERFWTHVWVKQTQRVQQDRWDRTSTRLLAQSLTWNVSRWAKPSVRDDTQILTPYPISFFYLTSCFRI